MSIDLIKLKKIYIIGIKGSGVVGMAEIFKEKGVEVLGSDTKEKFFTNEILENLNIQYFEDFEANHITEDLDLVVYSTAYKAENNVEFERAQELNLPMMSYPEILGKLFNEKYGLAVSGTHGKTTTSALLAHTLKECEKDPSAVIGSRVKDWGKNTLSGQGEYFVIEADEYQNKFKFYNPKGVILTSLDFDHPDYFTDFKEYKKAFADFVNKIPSAGFLVVWGDSVDTLEVAKSCQAKTVTYGFGRDCDFQVKNLGIKKQADKSELKMQKFEIFYDNLELGRFEIQLMGKHNILNAAAVIATCQRLGIDLEKVREALKTFSGTSRRFEYIGKKNGAVLIDDYGHHPEELKATLKATREIYPEKNIWAVFHPHSYSRTEALLQDFAQSFADANKVIVMDIYGSARENQGNVSSEDLVKLINKYDRDKAQHISTISEVVEFLENKLGEYDVVIAIGAGNVFEVVEKLKES